MEQAQMFLAKKRTILIPIEKTKKNASLFYFKKLEFLEEQVSSGCSLAE